MTHRNVTTSNSEFEYVATKTMLTMFKLLGLAPFNVRRSTRWNLSKKDIWQGPPIIRFSSSHLGCAYNLSLMALILYILILTLPMAYSEEYPNKSTVTLTLELTACALGYAGLFMTWLIHGFRQKTTVTLLNRLLSLDSVTLCLNATDLPVSSRSFLIFVCIVNGGMGAGLVCAFHTTYGVLVSNYIMLGIPTIVSMWIIVQYVFAVKLIENRYKSLNRSLLNCYVPSHLDLSHRLSDESEFTLSRISRPNIGTLRRTHSNLCEIALEISAFYSAPVLLMLGYSCYGIIYTGYYLIIPLVTAAEGFTNAMLITAVVWLGCRILPIVALATGVTRVMKETNKTGNVVVKLLTHSNNNYNETIELKQFLLELLHRKVKFTACGFFPLDCTLLLSIISTVITYLIIIVQFQLGSSTTAPNPGRQNTTDDEFIES